MLDERKMRILHAIVTDYVSSREPVGSKALVERHNLNVSSATVRNDMAVLEDEGYITQPHTSAGRVPTDKGYRLFVDRLATVKPLSGAEKRAIESFMAGAVDVDDVVRRTVQLLAKITHQVAIVQYPIVSTTKVRHLDVVELSADRLLLILVDSTGRVDQRPILLPADFLTVESDASSQVNVAKNRVAELVVGLSQTEALGKLATLVDGNVGLGAQPLLNVIAGAVMDIISDEPQSKVMVGGVPNLARFGAEFETALEPVLEALEEQVVLLRLLGQSAADQVSVRIGHENGYEQLHATSVVATSYGSPSDTWARLGIVGPTRMDYPSTIAAVRAVAGYVGRILAEG